MRLDAALLGGIAVGPKSDATAAEYVCARMLDSSLSNMSTNCAYSRGPRRLRRRLSVDGAAARPNFAGGDATVHELGLDGAITARKPTLDDVYLSLTGDSLAAAA
jgi:hypothetical protein